MIVSVAVERVFLMIVILSICELVEQALVHEALLGVPLDFSPVTAFSEVVIKQGEVDTSSGHSQVRHHIEHFLSHHCLVSALLVHANAHLLGVLKSVHDSFNSF